MDRGKINDYIAEMQDQSGDYILRNWQRNAIADYCIKHEQDTLKEFVEYLKSTKKYQAIGEDIDTRGISWGKRYTSPNHQFDKDLEKFLEERK